MQIIKISRNAYHAIPTSDYNYYRNYNIIWMLLEVIIDFQLSVKLFPSVTHPPRICVPLLFHMPSHNRKGGRKELNCRAARREITVCF